MNVERRFLLGIAALAISLSSVAEEGGSGHYFPGSMGSFIDGAPSQPTFLTRLNYLHYHGSVKDGKALPIAGLLVDGADVKVNGYALTVLWSPDIDMPDKLTYAMNVTVPVLDVAVKGAVETGRGRTLRSVSDTETGLGDVLFMPLMLNYQDSPSMATNFRIGIYAPTGDYTEGKIANTGKNYWSVEPVLGWVYLGQENGREASLFVGMNYNQENHDTDYQTGQQFHAEGTLAQHFPVGGSVAGIGVTGTYYDQVTGDSGSGATLGDFEGKASSAGPVLSYITDIGGKQIVSELKWLHEFSTTNRIKGDTIFFKLVYPFW